MANEHAIVFTAERPLDETLGHSFCYVRSSTRFLSPTPSDRFISPSQSLRFSPSHESSDLKSAKSGASPHDSGFRPISSASVSANTSTPTTVLQLDGILRDATDIPAVGGCGGIVNGFESMLFFSSLPLQPVPRREQSGPIERGALSGPLDAPAASARWVSVLGAARSWKRDVSKEEEEEELFGD